MSFEWGFLSESSSKYVKNKWLLFVGCGSIEIKGIVFWGDSYGLDRLCLSLLSWLGCLYPFKKFQSSTAKLNISLVGHKDLFRHITFQLHCYGGSKKWQTSYWFKYISIRTNLMSLLIGTQTTFFNTYSSVWERRVWLRAIQRSQTCFRRRPTIGSSGCSRDVDQIAVYDLPVGCLSTLCPKP